MATDLERALAIWRATRQPDAAHLVEAFAQRDAPPLAAVVIPELDDESSWTAAWQGRPVEELGALLRGLGQDTDSTRFGQRLARAWAEHPADPRVVRAAQDWAIGLHFAWLPRHRAWWNTVLSILTEGLPSDADVDALQQAVWDAHGPLTKAAKKAARALRRLTPTNPAPSPLSTSDRAFVNAGLRRFPARPRPWVRRRRRVASAEPLFDAIAADPNDLGARAVLGDWFVGHEHPFGRFLQLQIARHERELADPWRLRTPSHAELRAQAPRASNHCFGPLSAFPLKYEAGLPYELGLPRAAGALRPSLCRHPHPVVPDVSRFLRTLRMRGQHPVEEWTEVARDLDWSNLVHLYGASPRDLKNLAALWPKVRRVGVRMPSIRDPGPRDTDLTYLAAFPSIERLDITLDRTELPDPKRLEVTHLGLDLRRNWSPVLVARMLDRLPARVRVCDVLWCGCAVRFRRADEDRFAIALEPFGPSWGIENGDPMPRPFEVFHTDLDRIEGLIELGVTLRPTVHAGTTYSVKGTQGLAVLEALPDAPVHTWVNQGPKVLAARPELTELRQDRWTTAEIAALVRQAAPRRIVGFGFGGGTDFRLHRGASDAFEVAEISNVTHLQWLAPVAGTLRRIEAMSNWPDPRRWQEVERWCLHHDIELVPSPDHIDH